MCKRARLAVLVVLCGCGSSSPSLPSSASTSSGVGGASGASVTTSAMSSSSTGTMVFDTVTLGIQRFDGQSGMAMVSNGIPLQPGRLTATSDLANVRLLVGATEVPIHIEALEGTYPDGSIESLLLQLDAPVGADETVEASLVFGAPRTTTDLTKRPTSPTPRVAALPTDPEYLSSTRVAGRLVSLAKAQASELPSQVADVLADYPALSEQLWAAHGESLYDRFVNISGGDQNNIAVYEDVLTTYQYWLMTADAKYWQRANAMATDLRENFIENGYVTFTNSGCPNNDYTYCPSFGAEGEWVNSTEGLAVHYRVTGDDESRRVIGNQAQFLFGATLGFDNMKERDGNGRLKGRTLGSGVDALLLNGPTGATWGDLVPPGTSAKPNAPFDAIAWQDAWKGKTSLEKALDDSLDTESADGSFPSATYGNGQKNYMVAMLLSSWIRYYEEHDQDARLPVAIKNGLDWMWAHQWDATSQSFPYCSASGGDCATTPSPGLNGLLLVPYQWYAAYSKDPADQTRCDEIAAGLAADKVAENGWTYYPKLFDEAYYRFFNTLAWRLE